MVRYLCTIAHVHVAPKKALRNFGSYTYPFFYLDVVFRILVFLSLEHLGSKATQTKTFELQQCEEVVESWSRGWKKSYANVWC